MTDEEDRIETRVAMPDEGSRLPMDSESVYIEMVIDEGEFPGRHTVRGTFCREDFRRGGPELEAMMAAARRQLVMGRRPYICGVSAHGSRRTATVVFTDAKARGMRTPGYQAVQLERLVGEEGRFTIYTFHRPGLFGYRQFHNSFTLEERR